MNETKEREVPSGIKARGHWVLIRVDRDAMRASGNDASFGIPDICQGIVEDVGPFVNVPRQNSNGYETYNPNAQHSEEVQAKFEKDKIAPGDRVWYLAAQVAHTIRHNNVLFAFVMDQYVAGSISLNDQFGEPNA